MTEVLRERLAAQLLTGPPARTPEEVVGRLLAVQAQDPRGFRLSIRSRTAGLLASDVDVALTERRSLVVSWLQRGTLQLVRAEDHGWLLPLTAPRLTTSIRTGLDRLGVTPPQVERGVAVVCEQVADGPRTRAELRSALDAAGVPTDGQALVYLVIAASLRGEVVRGPVRGTEHCFVSARAWLGEPEPVERDEALARLARRYLAGHGPADDRDLARWAGVSLTDARQGLASLGDEAVRRPDGLLVLDGTPAADDVPPPRLLGAFDPVLLGWVSRADVVGSHQGLVTTNGLFRPFAMVGGRAGALWRLAGGAVVLQPLERVAKADLRRLDEDAQDVLRYLGRTAAPLVVQSPAVQ